jgi:two-component system, sensor histidine kinase
VPDQALEPPEAIEVQAAESRIAFAVTAAFTVLLAGTLYYVYDIFEPLAPPGKLNAWAAFMAGVTLIMAVVPVVVYLRRPDAAELVRVWDKLGKVVAVLYDLAVASSVWLLLPYASEPLQLLMVIFYSAAISGQVISTAESTDTIVFGVLAIFGSAAWFFLQTDSVYSISLAVFLLAFGAMLIAVSLILKQAIRTAIRLRLKAERISDELAAALEEAREARDARTRFIAAASHDLRQPLQAAALFFEQLRGTPSPAQRERAEAGVRLGLAEANALLERMLEHLKLESGTLEARVAPVPIAPCSRRWLPSTG